MKATGIIRRVDSLGRVVLPIELRRHLDVANGDPLEIFVDGDNVILRKYEPACLFCGETEGVVEYKGKLVCKKCREELRKW